MMKNDDHNELCEVDDILQRFRKSVVDLPEPIGKNGMEESPECGTPAEYLQVAMGTVEGAACDELLAHAAGCRRCSHLLALSLQTLEGFPSADEAAGIAELASARSEEQEYLSRALAGTRLRKRPRSGHVYSWLVAGAIAATLLLSSSLFVWYQKINTPDHLLAMAYSQSRTLELRIPEATYTGLVSGGHTRGAGVDNEPAALLDARARLTQALLRTPGDPHLQQLQARADVLDEHYDAACDMLDRLLATGPVTPELLLDAATAYYQRGLISGTESDRSTALDDLRRADEMAPTDPLVLFNEAIVMEDRGQMINAVEVWNRYITVERDAGWAAEGKRKLAELEVALSRLKSHQSRIENPMTSPEERYVIAGNPRRLAGLHLKSTAPTADRTGSADRASNHEHSGIVA